MTTLDGYSPQISWSSVVAVHAELVDPSVTGHPALFGGGGGWLSEWQIDMALERLVGCSVFRESDNVTKNRIPAAYDEIRHMYIPGLKLTCLTFLTSVIVQCLHGDSSCFGHYNRSCLLTGLRPDNAETSEFLTWSCQYVKKRSVLRWFWKQSTR